MLPLSYLRGFSARASHLLWLVAVEASSPSRIVITPGWHNHATASVPSDVCRTRLDVEEAPDESLISITLATGSATELRVDCPERVDLHARLSAPGRRSITDPLCTPAALCVTGKLEGDVTLECGLGDIEVGRIKGARVAITADQGAVRLRGALDARSAELDGSAGVTTARVAATTFRANGHGGGVDVSAIYSSSATMSVTQGGCLRIGGVHGTARAVAEGGGPPAILRGITGTLNLNAAERGALVHFDAPRGESEIIAGGDVDVQFTDSATLSVRLHVRARSVSFSEGADVETVGVTDDGSRTFLLRGHTAGNEISGNRGGSGKIREGSGITGFWSDGKGDAGSSLSVSTGGTVNIRILKYDARKKSLCPRCGASYSCGAKKSVCECAAVALKASSLNELRERFGDHSCLCLSCLNKIQLL